MPLQQQQPALGSRHSPAQGSGQEDCTGAGGDCPQSWQQSGKVSPSGPAARVGLSPWGAERGSWKLGGDGNKL